MLDVEGTRKGLDALADAAKTAQPAVRAAVEASLEVSKRAIDEVEQLQERVEEAEAVALAAGPHVQHLEDELTSAEIRLKNLQAARDADHYRRNLERRQKIAKRQAVEETRIAKALDAATAALEQSVPPLVETLVALRKRIVNDVNGKNVFQDTRKHGRWVCKNVNGVTIAECETRAEAIALVKRCLAIERDAASKTKLEDLDVSPGRHAPFGAPAERDAHALDCGPRVVADEDDDD